MTTGIPLADRLLGKLEAFVDLQAPVNAHVADKLDAIAESVAVLRENDVKLEAHRTRMHERFGTIATTVTEQSLELHKLDDRVRALETTVITWRGNMLFALSLAVGLGTLATTSLSWLAGHYGEHIIRGMLGP